jgi:predicted AlkP superfamily pyrophosphatase or phosphodiesterase
MRRLTLFLLCSLAFHSLNSYVSSPPQAGAGEIPPKDRIVVVISLDGFPAWTLQDATLPTPTLRRLAREGASAEGMKVVNPSVTWPNHTSMVTGVLAEKHGVLFNGLLVRNGAQAPKVDSAHDKAELVRVPTIYDLAFKAGLTTAQVDWVAIRNSGTITWEFPEYPQVDGAIEKEMVAQGLLTEKELKEFNKNNPTWRDQIWTDAAVYLIRKYHPNLLLVHLLNLDSVHHRYGPKTLAGYTAQAYIDTRVQKILDVLNTEGGSGRTTVFIVSDHGFKAARRTIRPNAALREQGLLRGEGSDLRADAYIIPEGGMAMAFVLRSENREQVLPKMKQTFLALEGVSRVLEPAQFGDFGLPMPAENNQMADLVLVAKDGYSFTSANTGASVADITEGTNPGNHGYISTDPDMNAIFIAWGYGIQSGQRLGVINNVDVAPTVAALLGLKMEGITGKTLTTILKPRETASTIKP